MKPTRNIIEVQILFIQLKEYNEKYFVERCRVPHQHHQHQYFQSKFTKVDRGLLRFTSGASGACWRKSNVAWEKSADDVYRPVDPKVFNSTGLHFTEYYKCVLHYTLHHPLSSPLVAAFILSLQKKAFTFS